MHEALMTEVRALIDDGALPVTIDEVRSTSPVEGLHSARRRGLLVATVAIAAACAITVAVVVSTHDGDRASAATFASAGVDCAPSPNATAQVFMTLRATDAETEAARAAIAAVPGVTIDRYLDRGDAHDQFACIFAFNPDLAQSVGPQDLPVSFAIKAESLDSSTLDRLRAVPAVSDIETPTSWSSWVAEQQAKLQNSEAPATSAPS